ncbi:MAG: site-specific integrase [Lachnospiraceae bacterium]|nr:site-specific integrase [Lachnospiraceae bacterium]
MTGSIIAKKMSSGKDFFYVHLSYKDPFTQKWKTKDIRTGLEIKGNKRKAEALVNEIIEKYSYLERLTPEQSDINPDIELCDFLDIWLEKKKVEVCGNTHDTYARRTGAIRRYFGPRHTKLRDVTPSVLDDFFSYCLQYGKVSQKDQSQGPLSVRSVRSAKSILFALFDYAIIKLGLPGNPVANTKVTNKRNSDFSEEMLFLSEDEIRDVLEFLAENYPFLKSIAFVGIYYGLRREEILGLKWTAVNYKRKVLTICHTVTGSSTIYETDKTKTIEGRRQLNLFPTAERCFRKLKEEQDANRAFFGNTYKDTRGYVFTHEDGHPYRPDYVTHKFSRAMDEFGRPEITLHKLRYTCASLLIDKGWDVKKVQYWLGDRDASTVMNIYAQYMKHKANSAENDLTAMSESVSDLFE